MSKFGADSSHARVVFHENMDVTAILWKGAKKMSVFFSSGRNVDILFTAEIDTYNGRESARIIIKDIDYSD